MMMSVLTSPLATSDISNAVGNELTAGRLYALLKLRHEVFVVEQGWPYPELDDKDLRHDTRHLWHQPRDEPVPLAYLRLLSEPDGTQRIGRVCTMSRMRGTGLGALLMKAALNLIGTMDSYLYAQLYVQKFYLRFGFQPVGQPFDMCGRDHIKMYRTAAGSVEIPPQG